MEKINLATDNSQKMSLGRREPPSAITRLKPRRPSGIPTTTLLVVKGSYSKKYHANLKDLLSICFHKWLSVITWLWTSGMGRPNTHLPVFKFRLKIHKEFLSKQSPMCTFFRPKLHVCAVMLVTMFCSLKDQGNAGSRIKMKNKERQGRSH